MLYLKKFCCRVESISSRLCSPKKGLRYIYANIERRVNHSDITKETGFMAGRIKKGMTSEAY